MYAVMSTLGTYRGDYNQIKKTYIKQYYLAGNINVH